MISYYFVHGQFRFTVIYLYVLQSTSDVERYPLSDSIATPLTLTLTVDDLATNGAGLNYAIFVDLESLMLRP